MTEDQWLQDMVIGPMVSFAEKMGSERKLRLFAHACCWRIKHLLAEQSSLDALVALEEYVEGKCTKEDLESHYLEAGEVADAIEATLRDEHGIVIANAHSSAACAVLCAVSPDITPTYHQNISHSAVSSVAFYASGAMGLVWFDRTGIRSDESEMAENDEALAQCHIIHDIFGNPFQSTTIAPGWLIWKDGTVSKLAQSIYDHQDFDSLPVLADALEEAGCTNFEILTHCRGLGQHVRGCWVVDLLLAKK